MEADLADANAEEANRAFITNKHDKARLLHLRTDPTAAALWSAALWEKNRTQLGDRDGQGGTVSPFDSSMILLTYMQMLVLFLIEQMKVVATSLRQVWKWWQDDALTLILLQRIVLSEMVHCFVLNGKN